MLFFPAFWVFFMHLLLLPPMHHTLQCISRYSTHTELSLLSQHDLLASLLFSPPISLPVLCTLTIQTSYYFANNPFAMMFPFKLSCFECFLSANPLKSSTVTSLGWKGHHWSFHINNVRQIRANTSRLFLIILGFYVCLCATPSVLVFKFVAAVDRPRRAII